MSRPVELAKARAFGLMRHNVRMSTAREAVFDIEREARAEALEMASDAVDAVARKFRAAHDPMSENAADECYAAIRALIERPQEDTARTALARAIEGQEHERSGGEK